MTFTVSRRPGTKPSLLASMPASLFGTFSPNGKGGALAKATEKPAPVAKPKPARKAAKKAKKKGARK